jgi:hypothetical protein
VARCGCGGSGGSGVGVADTPTVDLTLLGSIISGAVKLDPVTGNVLKATADGLRVDCSDILTCVGESAGIAVADSDGIDFTLTGSTVSGDLKSVYAQSSVVSFTHLLVAGAGVFVDINEVPDLVIPADGVYEVTGEAEGNATIIGVGPGSVVNAAVSIALYKNNVIVPNSETRCMFISQGTSTADQPALQLHATGSASRLVSCVAGDTFQLYASRNSSAGTTTQIVSNGDGRSRMSARRIGV